METHELYATFESESGFKALFDYATVGIVVVSNEGKIVMINPNAEKLFGYCPSELIGRKVETLIPNKLHSEHHSHRNQYFDNPKVRLMGAGLDLYAKRKDGSELPVEISLGSYKAEGETLAVAFISDITEQKKAEQDKKKYLAELEDKVAERTVELENALRKEHELSEMKSSFVSLASHEFRTPLSTILSSAALLERYDTEQYARKKSKHLNRIRSSVKNLVSVLNDFLSLDKLEHGKVRPNFEDFNILDLVNELKESFKNILKEGQKIDVSLCEDALVCSDKKLVENIIMNFISNASKYSGENELIETSCKIQDNKLIVSVKDNGIGIPSEDQKKLFGLFYRASNVETIRGTGLGLNIVKRYLDLLGGNINFSSKLGEGSTFMVEIPCKPKEMK